MPFLKSENARLNKIIAILLEQNEALKNEIAFRKLTNSPEEAPHAFPKVTNGNPDITLADANFTNGNLKVPDAHPKVTNGNPENIQALPLILPLDNGNIHRLYVFLKKEVLGKVHKSSVTNASKLLLHFYNKGRGDYTELRKLTGLSNFGLAKYIRSLKKRGLIERDGWQKFKLTAHAIGVIGKAGCQG